MRNISKIACIPLEFIKCLKKYHYNIFFLTFFWKYDDIIKYILIFDGFMIESDFFRYIFYNPCLPYYHL